VSKEAGKYDVSLACHRRRAGASAIAAALGRLWAGTNQSRRRRRLPSAAIHGGGALRARRAALSERVGCWSGG
jgi:hypothetical protein